MIKKKLIFGTQCLGSYLNKRDSLSLLNKIYDFGVKKFDTAERYPFPEKNETYGLTEEIIGNWHRNNRLRNSILIDTKVTGRNFGEIKSIESKRLSPKRIISAAEGSLKRLKTDYIDTFSIHWPDRFTNNFDRLYYAPENDPKYIPLEVQFEAIYRLKKSGKIRNFGVSNESAWGLSKFNNLSKKNKIKFFSQEEYSLLNRKIEIAMKEIFIRENIKFNAYSPLGGGLLTGKYFKNKKYNGRFNKISNFKKKRGYKNKFEKSKKIFNFCRKNSIDIVKLSFSFLYYQKFVNGIIFGLSSNEQFNEIKATLKKPIQRKYINKILDL